MNTLSNTEIGGHLSASAYRPSRPCRTAAHETGRTRDRAQLVIAAYSVSRDFTAVYSR